MSARLGDHIKHTRDNPCPICGKGRCATLLNNGDVHCFRVPSDRRTPSGMCWIHRREPDWRDRPYIPPRPVRTPEPKPPTPIPDVRDRGLRLILEHCPLSPSHREELRRRGLTDAQIDALPLGSLPDDEHARDAIAAAVVDELGPEAYGNVPGLYRAKNAAPRLNAHAGLMIGVEQDGRMVGITIRPNDAKVRADGKYRHLSSPPPQYAGGVGSGAPCGVIFPVGWVPGTPVTRVIVAEGILKAYIIANRTGLPVIAMPGATVTGDVLRLVRHLGATEVVLAYDNDRTINEHVANAERGLIAQLRDAGPTVFRLTWPEAHKGLDDALAAGVMPMLEPVNPAPATDDGAAREVAAVRAELAEERRANRELSRLNRGFVGVINNPHLTAGEKVVACRAVLEMKREAARGRSDGGRVRVSPARVALDFRTGTGEARNPSGSLPIMSRSSAIGGLQRLEARGLLDVEARPTRTRITKTNPRTGESYAKEVSVAEKWVAFADPAAALARIGAWQPEAPKERKPYTRKPTCPECGGTHLRTVCHDCGSIVRDSQPAAPDSAPPAPEPSRWKFSPSISEADDRVSSRSVDTEWKISTSTDEPPDYLDAAPDPTPPDDGELVAADSVLGSIRPTLAETDHAPDWAARRAANDELGRLLTDVGRSRGRSPVPKPPTGPPPRPNVYVAAYFEEGAV